MNDVVCPFLLLLIVLLSRLPCTFCLVSRCSSDQSLVDYIPEYTCLCSFVAGAVLYC